MSKITHYKIMVYGSSEGYQGNRAQITLYDDSQVVGFVRFHDRGMDFPDDEKSGEKIAMHLPSTMLPNMVDILRHERPLEINFRMGRAFFTSAEESVGEGE